MNILHVNMSLDPVTGGGTVERTHQLHTALNNIQGVSSRILSLRLASKSALEESEEVVLLPCVNHRWYLPAPKIITMYKMVIWADVIHLMNHWTVLNALIYMLARMSGTPYIICPAGAVPIFGRSSRFKRWYTRIVGASIMMKAAATIAVTEDEYSALQQYGSNKKSIYHIPNGVNAEDFAYSDGGLFRKHIGIGSEPYLLFVGRLNAIKGPDLLMGAFTLIAAEFPDLHLVFVGPDGGMLEGLKASVTREELAHRVHFAGYASGELKSSAYHGALSLVIPSRQEAMSIVALEAGICGTPVLMTDQCGFAEMAEAGAAIEVSPDEHALAQGIRALIQKMDQLDHMGTEAKAFVGKNYTWDIAAQKYRHVCEEVLSRE